MSGLAVTDRGPDVAAIRGRILVSGSLDAAEAGSDTVGSTLMQQLARELGALALGGAWPGRNTTEPLVYPYIAFFRVIRPNEIVFDGPTNMQPTRVQIDVVALRYSEAAAIASAARLMLFARFSVGALDEQDFPPDPDVDAFRIMLDVNLWSVD